MLANMIVRNPLTHPVIEMYLSGHELKFHADYIICITGASADCQINGSTIQMNQLTRVRKRDQLTIGQIRSGARTYLAVNGLIRPNQILGSYSGIPYHSSQRLHSGDRIIVSDVHQEAHQQSALMSPLEIEKSRPLKTYPGPELTTLTKSQKNILFNQEYLITDQSNRMGYRLAGTAIERLRKKSILSSAVLSGTVQLLPNGLPVILMRDCQTTGGYLRILQLEEQEINQLAQRRPGDTVRFTPPE
jgi:biotin-dependent carboxylase-like uncharacterized protein